MNCLEFERLLDEGELERLPEAALAHARSCEACARSLARARSLERALEAHFSGDAPAPPGFADRVMARVSRGESRGVRWLALPNPVPWWTGAALEPRVVLALAVMALFVWRGDRWLAGARAAWDGFAAAPRLAHDGWLAVGLGPLSDAFARAFAPVTGGSLLVQLGFALGVAPLLLLAGWLAWRAGERLVSATAAR